LLSLVEEEVEDEDEADEVAAAPPRPVKRTPSLPLLAAADPDADPEVDDAVLEEVVLVALILVGSWAPHGWSTLHEVWQAELPLHPATHWFPYSVHSKYGIVCE
jgi:hypothetical protein